MIKKKLGKLKAPEKLNKQVIKNREKKKTKTIKMVVSSFTHPKKSTQKIERVKNILFKYKKKIMPWSIRILRTENVYIQTNIQLNY